MLKTIFEKIKVPTPTKENQKWYVIGGFIVAFAVLVVIGKLFS